MTGTAAAAVPELLSRGAYSLYKTPDGGLHLAYRADGEEEDRHLPIPPAVMRMAEAAANGAGPFGRLKALAGLGKLELNPAERGEGDGLD